MKREANLINTTQKDPATKNSPRAKWLRFSPIIALIVLIGLSAATLLHGVDSLPEPRPSSTKSETKNSTTNPTLDGNTSTSDTIMQPAQQLEFNTETRTQQANPTTRPINTLCVSESIPYETEYISDPGLAEGKTITSGGYLGVREICTKGSSVVSSSVTREPTKRTIRTGAYLRTEAVSDARLACQKTIPAGSWDSTDMKDCINKKIAEFGF